MKRGLLVLGVATLVVLSFVGIAIADDSYVISEYSGASQRGNGLIVDHSVNWTKAPANPNVVYIAVWTPEPYRDYIKRALVEVVREKGLTPIVVDNVMKYDLKGRLVIAYFPLAGSENRILYREVSLSGVLYYSYAGDARSAAELMSRGFPSSEKSISEYADRLCLMSSQRLTENYIPNLSCGVAYWWNLKAKVGRLKEGNPYEMVAREIASQLSQFLRSDESNES